jgi:hypothetical protein
VEAIDGITVVGMSGIHAPSSARTSASITAIRSWAPASPRTKTPDPERHACPLCNPERPDRAREVRAYWSRFN